MKLILVQIALWLGLALIVLFSWNNSLPHMIEGINQINYGHALAFVFLVNGLSIVGKGKLV